LAAAFFLTDGSSYNTLSNNIQLFEEGQQVFVDADYRVFGVVDDVLEVGRTQPQIERVQHRAHARDSVINLEMAKAVPGESGHAVARRDSQSR
jgi:hypothetical protein